MGRDNAVIKVIWFFGKPEYFCKRGWTGYFQNDPTGKSVVLGQGQGDMHSPTRIKTSLRHSGARVSATPESRAIHLRIPDLRREAHPGMTREYGPHPADLLVPIMLDH
jgi:hypothetical protein